MRQGFYRQQPSSLHNPDYSQSRSIQCTQCLAAACRSRAGSSLCESRYRGHVPNTVFSFGDTYGNTTLKYFQDFRNAAMETSHCPYSKGGQFPTLFSPDPGLVLGCRARGWDRWLHAPSYSRFNLDFNRSEELKEFYKLSQRHREHYRDKTGTEYVVPYFVLPVKEKDKYPHPLDLSLALEMSAGTLLCCPPALALWLGDVSQKTLLAALLPSAFPQEPPSASGSSICPA
ncbi:UPF0573 protein C2orf70 like protein A [Chelonia mydas]|uniref:Ciliary microtubule inner protein 2C n=1 Tax=Chelonia mydas TaxID=8469 RepID=M7BFP9_CHEMY|nr:UPF0573 protein C2orf70 like protein A [Chelonia mydas]